jgi:hypothetical protein
MMNMSETFGFTGDHLQDREEGDKPVKQNLLTDEINHVTYLYRHTLGHFHNSVIEGKYTSD